jgi:hypothetical protein
MPPPPQHRKRVRTIRHNALLERLDPPQREALRLLLLDPGARLVTVQRWLAALGEPASMAGLCRYRQELRRERQDRAAAARAAEDEADDAVAYALAARQTSPALFYRGAMYLCQVAAAGSSLLLRSDEPEKALAPAQAYANAAVMLTEAMLRLDAREATSAATLPAHAVQTP